MIFPLAEIVGNPLLSLLLILIPILIGDYMSQYDIPDIYAYIIYAVLGYLILLSTLNLINMYGNMLQI